MDFNILDSILAVLLIALFVTVIFRYLRIPLIVGYLVVGVLVGPHALGWISDTQIIKMLAEFGIVFLMFTIGLEFSLAKLMSLKFPVFILGGLQVLISLSVTTIIGMHLGMKLIPAFVIGAVVAMSSTALVMKQLTDQAEMNASHSINALSIL